METSVEQKTLKYYLDLKYPITIHPAPEGGFVAEIEDLPGCLAQGETLAEVYELIEEARQMWLEVAYEDGIDISEPRDEKEYSGKFFIRTPKSLHRTLAKMAEREGVSLNQFLVATLSKAVGVREVQALQDKKRSK